LLEGNVLYSMPSDQFTCYGGIGFATYSSTETMEYTGSTTTYKDSYSSLVPFVGFSYSYYTIQEKNLSIKFFSDLRISYYLSSNAKRSINGATAITSWSKTSFCLEAIIFGAQF
jgi:hypothetical protein